MIESTHTISFRPTEKRKRNQLRNGDLISFRSRFIALLVVITFSLGIDAGGIIDVVVGVGVAAMPFVYVFVSVFGFIYNFVINHALSHKWHS